MGAFKCVVVLDCDSPPKILVGQRLGGGIVKEIKEVQTELLSASQLAEKYSVSTDTVHRKLSGFSQGTRGKFLFDSKIADEILDPKTKRSTGGARRKN